MAVCFTGTQHAFSRETFKCGPYSLYTVMNYYVIVEKVPCKVTVTVDIKDPNKGERLLMRVYDPDEEEIKWIYKDKDDYKYPSSKFMRFFNRIMGNKPPNSISNITEEITLKDKAGIYEFRFYGGLHNSTVMLESDQKLEYGISWQSGALKSFSETPATMYVYIPRGLDSLTFLQIRNGLVTIDTGKGIESAGKGNKKIEITGHDVVWKAVFPGGQSEVEMKLDMPMIFCTSEAAARKIKNSVEVADDGSWMCFIPQQKIPEIINRLWDKKYVGEPDGIIIPLSSIKEKLLSDPVKYQYTIGPRGFISMVPSLISEQEKRKGKLPIIDMQMLSIAAGIGPEINPYYHKKEIVYRAAVALLYCLYNRLAEDELISTKPGTDKSLGGVSNAGYDRSGTHAGWEFSVCFDTAVVADTFGHIGAELKKLDPEAYGVIASLMRRMIDRQIAIEICTTRNKSSNLWPAIWQFYKATGEERYREAALRYIYHQIDNRSAAGYDMEESGPEATYQGLNLYNTALLYSWTKDERILEHIRIVYALFNYTVAPEPDNAMIGGSSFSHRTIGGFERAQYGKGMHMMAGQLPEVAIWMANFYANSNTCLADAKRLINEAVENPSLYSEDQRRSSSVSLVYPRYEFHADPAKINELLKKTGYTWPALETNDFIRNFGNEFIAVKRKGYYLCIYAGHPGSEYYIRNRLKLRKKHPIEGNANAGKAEFQQMFVNQCIAGWSGGNIVLLWSKDYGTSVMGYNVAPATRHGLIFTDAAGDRWWDDYLKTEFTLDEQRGILHVKGRIENQPVRYERIYDFKEDHLEYTLKLFAESATNAVSLVENFPVLMKYKKGSVDVSKADYNGQSAVRMTSKSTGKSVIIANDKNLEVEILPDYVGGHGSVQFHLPASLEAGKEWSVLFSVVPEGLEAVGGKNQ